MCKITGTYLCPGCGMLYTFNTSEDPDKGTNIDSSYFLTKGNAVGHSIIDDEIIISHGEKMSTFPYKRFYYCEICDEENKIKMSLLIFSGISYTKDDKLES